MDDSFSMGIRQRICDISGNLDGVFNGELSLFREPSSEGLALHIRHHVKEEAVGLTGVIERKDVRVREVGGRFDFTKEAFGA
jgi:hypothetical protein